MKKNKWQKISEKPNGNQAWRTSKEGHYPAALVFCYYGDESRWTVSVAAVNDCVASGRAGNLGMAKASAAAALDVYLLKGKGK